MPYVLITEPYILKGIQQTEQGSVIESFEQITNFLRKLVDANPGTVTAFERTDNNVL